MIGSRRGMAIHAVWCTKARGRKGTERAADTDKTVAETACGPDSTPEMVDRVYIIRRCYDAFPQKQVLKPGNDSSSLQRQMIKQDQAGTVGVGSETAGATLVMHDHPLLCKTHTASRQLYLILACVEAECPR